MSDNTKVVQFETARKEKQNFIKREYERVLFQRLLGCYTVVESVGLRSIELMDISKSGCSFKVPAKEFHFAVDEELDMRLYFSNSTFLPCRVQIRRKLDAIENGLPYVQYGCTFDSSLSTFPALEKFIDFIAAYSESAKEDKGDLKIWYLWAFFLAPRREIIMRRKEICLCKEPNILA